MLAEGLAAAANQAQLAHTIGRVGSMLTVFFNADPVLDWDAASRCDTQAFARFFWGMLERGIYLPCSQFEALFVSLAHTREDIQNTLDAAADTMATLK